MDYPGQIIDKANEAIKQGAIRRRVNAPFIEDRFDSQLYLRSVRRLRRALAALTFISFHHTIFDVDCRLHLWLNLTSILHPIIGISTIAAIQALIMMKVRDRAVKYDLQSANDFNVNMEFEREIRLLHEDRLYGGSKSQLFRKLANRIVGVLFNCETAGCQE